MICSVCAYTATFRQPDGMKRKKGKKKKNPTHRQRDRDR